MSSKEIAIAKTTEKRRRKKKEEKGKKKKDKSRELRFIAIAIRLRTGCRGGTPGWGRSPHTPFKANVLSNLVTAIRFDAVFCVDGFRVGSDREEVGKDN
ncbi:hypothetical protein [Leptothermofonsia sp. ETS-13]|uniref:hypothetical protein n=1 Tax=Leptothermofonsia sp. ETS-13 TaxID=3035696 RepID=UPI003B9E05C1